MLRCDNIYIRKSPYTFELFYCAIDLRAGFIVTLIRLSSLDACCCFITQLSFICSLFTQQKSAVTVLQSIVYTYFYQLHLLAFTFRFLLPILTIDDCLFTLCSIRKYNVMSIISYNIYCDIVIFYSPQLLETINPWPTFSIIYCLHSVIYIDQNCLKSYNN